MDEPSSAAALALLRWLAQAGVEEAAAFVEQQQRHHAALAHAGGRRMLGEDLTSGQEATYIIISVCLVIFAGIMAGLTLGLLSLDKVDLEVIKRSGTEKQIWLVQQVEPLLSNPHFLLATLLLCNASAMEALPIFLDRLLNPVAAIVISVTAILIFGEIVPQAVCKRYGLQVGAVFSWPVRILMLLTSPVTWPIAKILDCCLGDESALFRRQELKALVDIHAEDQEGEEVATLTLDEAQVIQGALDMATKTAESAMTPVDKVSMLSADATVDLALLHDVINAGHSRLPVYDGSKQNILGLVLVKELVLVDENAGVKVRDLRVREVPFLRSDTPLYDTLKIFRMGRSHMAFLTRVTNKLADEEGSQSAAQPEAEAESKERSPKLGFLARGSVAALRPFARLVKGASGKWEEGAELKVGSLAARTTSGAGEEASLVRPSGGGLAGLSRLLFKPATSSSADEQAPEEVIGIITIEDVLEELLQAEILDETDQFQDNLQTVQATRLLTVQHLPPELRVFLTRKLVAGGTPGSTRRSRGGSRHGGGLFAAGRPTPAAPAAQADVDASAPGPISAPAAVEPPPAAAARPPPVPTTARAATGSRPVSVRLPPANIPRRGGGSSASLANSIQENESVLSASPPGAGIELGSLPPPQE